MTINSNPFLLDRNLSFKRFKMPLRDLNNIKKIIRLSFNNSLKTTERELRVIDLIPFSKLKM